MINKIPHYLSLVKFSHTIFAMPFAMIGFFLGYRANGDQFSWKLLILVVLCMVFARSAAMAFNRWLDARFDRLNPRTAVREIPAGIITGRQALGFVIVCCLLFIGCTWFINTICFLLSPVALIVVLGYSYTKRFTALCHLVLGIGLALAPIGAYLAVSGEFAWLPLLFSFTVLCWVAGFDIIYALQDMEFDRSQHLNSIPALLGKARALRVSEALHLLSAIFLAIAGYTGGLGLFYWIGLGVFALLLVYQHSLVKPNDLRRVNLAFFTTNGIASLVFGVLVLTDLFWRI